VSLADVGSCACSGSDGQADGDGDADAGDGDDPATGGDGAGTIGAGGGSAGTDGDVGAGAAPDAIGGTTGGSTDQVLVADDQVAPSSGTGVQGEAADGDGSKSGDLDSVGGKDGKDGEVDGSGDGTAGGPDDGTADGMLGGLIDFTTEDGSLGLGLVEAVESLAGDGETIGAPVGPLGALSVCRTQFALAALEGLEILDLCGVGAAEEALADEVDGRLGLDVDVDGSASPAVVGGAPSANGDAVAGVELHARSTMGTGAGAGLDVGVAGTDLAGTDLAAAPCGCDGGSTPSVGVTIGVDLAAGADDDAILADGGLGVSSALGIG
jgi:hypothetical protein